MPEPSRCQAIREGDEWVCAPCAVRWSVNDADPPGCRPGEHMAATVSNADAELAAALADFTRHLTDLAGTLGRVVTVATVLETKLRKLEGR